MPRYNTPVLMYDGRVKMVQDIEAGELVIWDLTRRPRKVLSTIRGRDEMYQVMPMKGEPYTVNADHILSLRVSGYTDKHKKFKEADSNGLINMSRAGLSWSAAPASNRRQWAGAPA